MLFFYLLMFRFPHHNILHNCKFQYNILLYMIFDNNQMPLYYRNPYNSSLVHLNIIQYLPLHLPLVALTLIFYLHYHDTHNSDCMYITQHTCFFVPFYGKLFMICIPIITKKNFKFKII